MTPTPPRRRGWRIAVAVLGTLVLLGAGAYIALLRAFPPERLAALLADEVRAVTGRDFRIGGALSIRLLPAIAVVAEDVALGNAAWGSRKEMATVKRAAFALALAPLLDGRLHVLSVDVDGADVLLETDDRGHANWIFEQRAAREPRPQAEDAAAPPPVRLDRVTLSDSRFAFRVGLTKATHAVDIESLQAVSQGEQTAVSVRFGGRHGWRLDGKTGRYEALARGGADWPFDLQLATDGARLAATGTLDAAGTLHAKVSARIERAAALAPLLDAAALPMPIEANATLERTATAVAANGLRASIGGQELSGRLTVHTRPGGPRIEADLAAPTIDLPRWGLAPAAAAAAPGAA